ncbi:MAG: hypothetical protein R3F21_23450 [Myxococcota bacterium]
MSGVSGPRAAQLAREQRPFSRDLDGRRVPFRCLDAPEDLVGAALAAGGLRITSSDVEIGLGEHLLEIVDDRSIRPAPVHRVPDAQALLVPASGAVPSQVSNPEPAPYQLGSRMRVWFQENVQGIAPQVPDRGSPNSSARRLVEHRGLSIGVIA